MPACGLTLWTPWTAPSASLAPETAPLARARSVTTPSPSWSGLVMITAAAAVPASTTNRAMTATMSAGEIRRELCDTTVPPEDLGVVNAVDARREAHNGEIPRPPPHPGPALHATPASGRRRDCHSLTATTAKSCRCCGDRLPVDASLGP